VPVAGANDGGGSIRIPAACCGLFGLKAGRGLVPHGPADAEGGNGLAAHGVVSRSVRDTAAMLDVLAGADPYAPYLPAEQPPGHYLAEAGRAPGRLRIGVRVASALNPTPSPAAVAAVEDASALLTDLGHEVERVEPVVDERALAADFLTYWFVKAAHLVDEARRVRPGDDGFESDTLITAEMGRATGALDVQRAVSSWHGHTRALVDFHRSYDLLLTPTLAASRCGSARSPPPRGSGPPGCSWCGCAAGGCCAGSAWSRRRCWRT